MIPGALDEEPEPLVALVDGDSYARDTSKPVAYDEHGQPLYAPPAWGSASKRRTRLGADPVVVDANQ